MNDCLIPDTIDVEFNLSKNEVTRTDESNYGYL
ncbi:hypothetical protein SAMN05216238_11082 [Lentibacillus persicus]|uniref:Uncharacterized protein n=1 Tax=Lentibacillus persicus TaxID=640948 RepID=A0A1I1YRX0_9BACI|nr:hypothetical protein SAMN05216238_11082 [Lentibacillus persicus]